MGLTKSHVHLWYVTSVASAYYECNEWRNGSENQ